VAWDAAENSNLPIATFLKALRADASTATIPVGGRDVAQAVDEVAV
jgi:hypothetical protein